MFKINIQATGLNNCVDLDPARLLCKIHIRRIESSLAIPDFWVGQFFGG